MADTAPSQLVLATELPVEIGLAYGDIISVCDTSANGHAAFVKVDDWDLNTSHYKATVSDR
ncbi:hypothetical protein [Streptomyces drozdowiczii]|uniref:Uncharacterized protein n=1 Tax=Streptomyces drozdowiczii TaxID=202862 RepID=A0ABY6PKA0_9ACTN|nr:hypothetical protein [Streptomyces drozdowiczii]MCX0241905.1 hypothetical protein [Streptomyces drozdowiczii]UZK52733.1 hypothetical protein NEH16_00140 [Streptomyces drozdowiczii]UZK57983.1 hypothetical protein NEH16_31325 [Streptomyces drozdowiczii]